MHIISIILSNILVYAYLRMYTYSHFFLKNTVLSCSLLLTMNIIWCTYIRFAKIAHVSDTVKFIVSIIVSYFISIILVSMFIVELGFFRIILEMIFTGILYVIVALVGFIYTVVCNVRND